MVARGADDAPIAVNFTPDATQARITEGQAAKACVTENTELKRNVIVSVPVFVAIIVGAVAVGAGITAGGVALANGKKP